MAHRPQWFEYDWPSGGKDARFRVDLALASFPAGALPVLMYLSCESAKEGAKRLSALESSLADSLVNQAAKKLGAAYAGSIETGAQRQYYLYVSDRSLFGELERIAKRARLIRSQTGFAEEPEWTSYHGLLYPDAAKMQTEENRKRIELMAKHGDTPAAARRIALYVFFPNESTRLLYSEQARLSGFAVGEAVFEPEHELAHGVALYHIASLDKREVDRLTTRAIRIAEKYEGVLRYWDAPITKRQSPLM